MDLNVMSARRAAAIRQAYRPLHPQVYNLKVFGPQTRVCSAVMHR